MSVLGKCFDIFLLLVTWTMFCMGVAMINIGATNYEEDVSTYLIIGGISVMIFYLGTCQLPLRQIQIVRKKQNTCCNGEPNEDECIDCSFCICFLLPFGLVYLCILIWGTVVIASGKVIFFLEGRGDFFS